MTEGLLTGKIDETTTLDASEFRNTILRFSPENWRANQALMELLGSIAERKKAAPTAGAVQASSFSNALAPGCDEAGFWPVTSRPSVTTKGFQFSTFS